MRVGSAITLAVLGAIVIGIGRVFGLLEMYVIGTGLVCTSILAIVITSSRVVLVEVERHLTNAGPRVGDNVGIELTLRAVRRSPAFDFIESVSDSSASTIGRVEISVPPLRRGHETVNRYRIRAERRGVVSLGPATATCGDPLGLVRRSRRLGPTDEIIVEPEWLPIALPVPRICEGDLVSAIESLARHRASELEFRSIRDYVPGDDARLVNWKVTAKKDSLVVNEYESRSTILLDVFLDDRTESYSPDGFETAISVAASFVASSTSVEETDIRVRLSLGSRDDSSSFDAIIDEDNRRDAMRSLALLRSSQREPQPRSAHQRSLVSIPVLICGRRSIRWFEMTHRALRGSSIAVVVSCEGPLPVPLPERWLGLQATDIGSFARQWARLSRRILAS